MHSLYLDVLLFSLLPVYRVLMVGVYDRIESFPVVMLMHAPLAGSQIILMPPAISAASMVSFDLLFAAALRVVVGAVLVTNRRQISSQPRSGDHAA